MFENRKKYKRSGNKFCVLDTDIIWQIRFFISQVGIKLVGVYLDPRFLIEYFWIFATLNYQRVNYQIGLNSNVTNPW